jgi:hypothetical protein
MLACARTRRLIAQPEGAVVLLSSRFLRGDRLLVRLDCHGVCLSRSFRSCVIVAMLGLGERGLGLGERGLLLCERGLGLGKRGLGLGERGLGLGERGLGLGVVRFRIQFRLGDVPLRLGQRGLGLGDVPLRLGERSLDLGELRWIVARIGNPLLRLLHVTLCTLHLVFQALHFRLHPCNISACTMRRVRQPYLKEAPASGAPASAIFPAL